MNDGVIDTEDLPFDGVLVPATEIRPDAVPVVLNFSLSFLACALATVLQCISPETEMVLSPSIFSSRARSSAPNAASHGAPVAWARLLYSSRCALRYLACKMYRYILQAR